MYYYRKTILLSGAKINVLNKEISLYTFNEDDYISITDIAKHKNTDTPAEIIKN